MPLIPLDFGSVDAFDNLPLGVYPGQIDKIELRPATDPTKFDQLMVTYLVTDGDSLGRKSSEFLSLSPKAAFRLKKWFDKFGIVDQMTGLNVDDETNLLVDPELVGVDVMFKVYEDPKLYQGEKQVRTALLSVEDYGDEVGAPEAEPEPEAPAVAAAAPAMVTVTSESLNGSIPPAAVAPVTRPLVRPTTKVGPARRALR